jgi:hypothetical protein
MTSIEIISILKAAGLVLNPSVARNTKPRSTDYVGLCVCFLLPEA